MPTVAVCGTRKLGHVLFSTARLEEAMPRLLLSPNLCNSPEYEVNARTRCGRRATFEHWRVALRAIRGVLLELVFLIGPCQFLGGVATLQCWISASWRLGGLKLNPLVPARTRTPAKADWVLLCPSANYNPQRHPQTLC
jgi:hypothetical protein